ncbi:MAG: efflux RND transporter periplasmic adaptor subunit [Negativicutes bacterium]|nr:efflux RND transporter periplasmic adaptor subunit [Negativicutes bacterium]
MDIVKNLPTKKIVLALIVGIMAFGGWYYWSSSQVKPEDLNSKAVVVERKDLISTISATGTINAIDSVDVSSKITGRIVKVNVVENSRVTQGDVLMLLDDQQIRSQVEQTQANLDNSKSAYDRHQTLFDQGAIAAQTLEDAERTYRVASANHANLLSQMSDTVIQAPISGMVIGKPISEGQTVAPGISTPMVLMTLANLDKMEIEALVDETDIGHVQEGMKTTFQVDTYPDRTYTGKVTKISKKATTSQSVVYYKVIILVDKPEGILPGMTARVTIQTAEKLGVLSIPLRFVRENKGKKVVQVLVDGKAEERIIETGFSNEESIEVLSGLKEGEKVIPPKSTNANGNLRVPRM